MLNQEQQDIIENSIWVVNTALKKQGLQADEDLRQSAILYLCKCLERFDATKGIKWTTFAYKNIYLFIKKRNAREKIRQSALVSDEILNTDQDNKIDFDKTYQRDLLEHILSRCTKIERDILELQMQGYTINEISLKLGCSVSNIVIKIRDVRKRFQGERNEEVREPN